MNNLTKLAIVSLVCMSTQAFAQGFTAGGREGDLDVRGRMTVQGDKKRLDENVEKLDTEQVTYERVSKKTSEVVQCHTQGLIPDGEGGCKSVEELLPAILDKSKLELWLDASDSDSVVIQNSKVVEWHDKSGKGHVFEQHKSESKRPTYSSVNKAVNFRNNPDANYLKAVTNIENPNSTVFVVVGPWGTPVSSNPEYIFSYRQAGQQHAVGRMASPEHIFYKDSSSLKYINKSYAVFERPSGEKNVLAIRPKASINKRVRMFNYYLPHASGNLVNVGAGAVSGSGMMISANLDNSQNSNFQGDIHEVIVYGRTLDDTETEEITNYLLSKWNVQVPAGCGGATVPSILGQCTPSVTAELDITNGSMNVNCLNSYNKNCTAKATCEDGSISLDNSYCEPPSNCSADVKTISNNGLNCNANVPGMNHGATALDISCKYAGAYGDCIAKASCNNGTVTVSNANCAALTPCPSTNISNCSVAGGGHTSTSGSCASGYSGSCNYQCLDGSWSQNSNSCVAYSGCTQRQFTGCNLNSASHGTTQGFCVSGYRGSCSYTCNNGNWQMGSNSCAQTFCPALNSNTWYSFLSDPLLDAHETHTSIASSVEGTSVMLRMREDDGNSSTNDKVDCKISCNGSGNWQKVSCNQSSCDSRPSGTYYVGSDDDNYELLSTLQSTQPNATRTISVEVDGRTRTRTFTCTEGKWYIGSYLVGWFGESRSCSAASIDAGGFQAVCDVPLSSHGAVAGSCGDQAVQGSCSYTCNNGAWDRNYDTCEGD